jgi:hypoxanthine-guanine phosphoribosyltransferase
MKKAAQRLKEQFEENPVLVIGVLSAAALAAAKLIDAGNNTRNAQSWARETKRRDRKSN